MIKDPTTPEEWQEAVDLAATHLRIDAARKYGIMTGGPEIDIERCVGLLKAGKEKGVTPSPGCVERILKQMVQVTGRIAKTALFVLLVPIALLGGAQLFQKSSIRSLQRSQSDLLEIVKAHRGLQNNLFTNVLTLETNQNWITTKTFNALGNHLSAIENLRSNQNTIGFALTIHLFRYQQEHPQDGPWYVTPPRTVEQ